MPTNTVVSPTSWVTSVFNAFDKVSWGEIAIAVEKRSLGGAITSAEHVAEALAASFAAAGNQIALGAEAVLPAAESILGAVLNLIPALHPNTPPPAMQPALPPSILDAPKNNPEDDSKSAKSSASKPSGSSSK